VEAIRSTLTNTRLALVGMAFATLTVVHMVVANAANAAASPTTGVDYVADLVTPIKSELTLAIVAGLGLLAILMALRGGVKLIRSFGK
jgi:hypothetical protein